MSDENMNDVRDHGTTPPPPVPKPDDTQVMELKQKLTETFNKHLGYTIAYLEAKPFSAEERTLYELVQLTGAVLGEYKSELEDLLAARMAARLTTFEKIKILMYNARVGSNRN